MPLADRAGPGLAWVVPAFEIEADVPLPLDFEAMRRLYADNVMRQVRIQSHAECRD
jgi:hypothetical protein